jgi:type IV secretion system protein VirB8
MRTEPEVAAYFEAARDWDCHRSQAAARSERRAWWVAGLATLLALLAVAAVAGLTPMKTVEAFVIRVDNTTGIVDVVPALTGQAEVPEAVTRFFLSQYVQARERYVAALAESDYEQVGAFHTPAMNQAWAALWNRNRADSPLNLNADGSTVRVQVNAVSFLSPASGRNDLAQVRFLTARAPAGQGAGQGGTEQVTQYVATLQYAYGEPSKDDRVRAANPLGFKVLEYRKEPELQRSVAVSAASGAAP